MTKLLQCLRDELVRRDYAAPTIRSYIQIVEAFHEHTGARLDRLTPAQLRRSLRRSLLDILGEQALLCVTL